MSSLGGGDGSASSRRSGAIKRGEMSSLGRDEESSLRSGDLRINSRRSCSLGRDGDGIQKGSKGIGGDHQKRYRKRR